jgi:hypothetical protein
MKHYSPTGRRNHGRPLKRLLDTWDRNGSTSGPTAWQIDDIAHIVCVCVNILTCCVGRLHPPKHCSNTTVWNIQI